MDKKELKKLMTRVAKGEISKEEAQKLINPEKTAQNRPVKQISKGKKKDHARKR